MALLEDINNATQNAENLSEEDRAALLAATEKLRESLETPVEMTTRVCFLPLLVECIRLGVDMELFDAAASAEGDKITLDHLASKTGHDRVLISRIVRALAAGGVFRETGKDTYSSTKLSKAYVSASPLTQLIILGTHSIISISHLHDYFAARGYKNPDDSYNACFQHAFNTKLHSFEWLAQHPRQQNAFNFVMTMRRRNESQTWLEYFPVVEKLAVSPAEVALVDIGGGMGHDLVALKKAHPDLSGKLVLQDLPGVIESAKKELPGAIDAMPYDMFESQPVKGARAYFLRNVLHDWPDKQCGAILSNIRGAMGSESRLLISEALMPETNAPFYNCAADLVMMANLAGMDRTEAQFRVLLEENGFELVKVWRPEGAQAGAAVLFEAKKA